MSGNGLFAFNGGRLGVNNTSFVTKSGVYTSGPINFIMSIVPVTQNFTLDATWDDPVFSTDFSTLSSVSVVSVRVDVDMLSTDTGIILEAGGSGLGLVLYVFNGTLYFQAGDGGSFGDDADTAEVSWPIIDGPSIIEWSGNGNTGKVALYIDGTLVSQSTYSGGGLSGADTGGRGQVHSQAAANRGGWTNDGEGAYTDQSRIGPVEIFLDEVTADVS